MTALKRPAMRTLLHSSLAFALLLTACDKAPPPSQAPAAASTAAAQASRCPADDFDAFLPLFQNDVSLQKAYVTDPLQSDSVDPNADPEPKPVSKMLAKAEVTFPVMPSQADQAKDGLTATRTATSPTEVTIKLAKPDTDYQMSFFFRKNGCWQLYRVKDDSL